MPRKRKRLGQFLNLEPLEDRLCLSPTPPAPFSNFAGGISVVTVPR
jgi:hypothetical protein